MAPLKRGVLIGLLVSFAVAGWTAVSQAATCTVDTIDPNAFITGAKTTTSCGLGLANDDNDSAGDIGTILGGAWVTLDKSDNAGDLNVLSILNDTKSGDWFLDLDPISSYTSLVLVLKDGEQAGNGAKWVWFELDLTGGCSIGGAPAGTDICGEWQLYGDKELSHASLYGSNPTTGNQEVTQGQQEVTQGQQEVTQGQQEVTQGQQEVTQGTNETSVPGPAPLVLIGLGLAGVAALERLRRRR